MNPESVPVITRIFPAKRKNNPIQFSTALAHEIRNPLTNINLSVQMLEYLAGDDSLKPYLEIIMRSSIRINDLINELLANQEKRPEKHSIHLLLDEILAMTEDRLTLKNIVLLKTYTLQDDKMLLNKPQLKIALTNIIINAIEAMSPGKGKLKITTRLVDGNYEIQIEDNGHGISKQDLKHLFKPYFTKKPGGLGLGLSTTFAILQSNHISVNVESEEAVGTCFILSFKKNYPSETSPQPETISRLYRNSSHRHFRRNPAVSGLA